MSLPPGFFFRAVQLMPESEPADFSLSDSLSLISSLPFFPGNAPANRQGPEGHLLPPATLASQDAPDGSHSGCSLKSSQLPSSSAHRKGLLAPHAFSSYTLGSQLIEGTFFICGELMGELVTDKLKSWLLLFSWWYATQTGQCLERKFNQPQTEKASTNVL